MTALKMTLFQLLFSLNGRISRREFWYAFAVFGCTWFVLLMIIIGIALAFGARKASADFGILPAILCFPILIKRLHDRNKSSWWLIVFCALPLGLSYIADATDMGLEFLLSLTGDTLAIWGLIELGCLRGTTGPNRFGDDPLAANSSS